MAAAPPFPEPFRTAVLGTVFGERAAVAARLAPGDAVILVPDAPDVEDPTVWVHAPGGDVVGHLDQDVGGRLARWMLLGGRCGAIVAKVAGSDVESWRRLLITVNCREG